MENKGCGKKIKKGIICLIFFGLPIYIIFGIIMGTFVSLCGFFLGYYNEAEAESDFIKTRNGVKNG